MSFQNNEIVLPLSPKEFNSYTNAQTCKMLPAITNGELLLNPEKGPEMTEKKGALDFH